MFTSHLLENSGTSCEGLLHHYNWEKWWEAAKVVKMGEFEAVRGEKKVKQQ